MPKMFVSSIVAAVALVSWGAGGEARLAAEELQSGWDAYQVGWGIKPSFDFAPDGRLHVTGMTEKFSNGVLWHSTAEDPAGPWQSQVVASSFFYGPGDLRVDHSGSAQIAVHDHRARDAMHVEVHPVNGATVRHIATPGERDGWDNSLALDSLGMLYQVTVNPAGPGVVDSLSFNRFSNGHWAAEVIAGSGDFTHSLGTSVAFDENDRPHILYTPARSQTEATDLMHSWHDGTEWQTAAIATEGIRGRFSSLAFDAADQGHAAWIDLDANDSQSATVMYGHYAGSQWTMSPIAEMNDVRLGPTGGLKLVTLALDGSGTPHVAFGDTRSINYARLAGERWQVDEVLTSDVARYNGLSVLRLHPLTQQPHIAIWEPHPTEDGVVRLLAGRRSQLVGDFDTDGVLTVADIDLLVNAITQFDPDVKFDVNGDAAIDLLDHAYWVNNLGQTQAGDANLDGSFTSTDIVQIFEAGKYEVQVRAGWGEGDWNGDLRFDASDLVAAFTAGNYETDVAPVPEPNSAWPWMLATLWAWGRRFPDVDEL